LETINYYNYKIIELNKEIDIINKDIAYIITTTGIIFNIFISIRIKFLIVRFKNIQ
jgi:hypothetical protein